MERAGHENERQNEASEEVLSPLAPASSRTNEPGTDFGASGSMIRKGVRNASCKAWNEASR